MKYLLILSILLSFAGCSSIQTVPEEPFSVDLEAPNISVGIVEAYFERFMSIGGLANRDITVDYYPDEDAVCLQFRVDFMTYYQFWTRDNREYFLAALEQYKEDFTQRNLNTRGSKRTKRQYGVIPGFLIWQSTRFTLRSSGYPDIEIGYFLRSISGNRVSFFTLNQREAEYQDVTTGSERVRSPEILIYFSRSQADELAAMFDQQLLDSLLTGRIRPASDAELDSY